MRTALNFVLDLIFPAVCQNCGQEGGYLCTPCQELVLPAEEKCLICDKPATLGKIHDGCRSRNWHLEGLLVAASYRNESIRKLIWYLKYSGIGKIGEVLALLMTDCLAEKNLLDYFSGHAVVPVPLHRRRLRWRGFNQTELVARNFAARLGLEYLPILRKIKSTPRQVDLDKQARLENLADSIACKPGADLAGRKIILIDDVATTGATLNECAKVLKAQGAAEIWGFVVARN